MRSSSESMYSARDTSIYDGNNEATYEEALDGALASPTVPFQEEHLW